MEYDSRFLTRPKNSDILVFSAGNPSEAHGPALPHDIDTKIAQMAAIEAAYMSGATYLGNIPFTTDGIGEIARVWSPAYIPVDEFMRRTRQFVDMHLGYQRSFANVKGIVFVVGHGGIPQTLGEEMKSPGIETRCVFPTMFGSHADEYEHSCSQYLGLLDNEGLDMIHEVAKKDPNEALRRWPVLLGLSGFWLYHGDEFAKLYKPHKMEKVKRFRDERIIRVDRDFGRNIFDKFVSASVEGIKSIR
ncbi:hypothetical protein BVX95_01080 [archaeon D22]|nr:hypothetical protein BVX95_01080 [archaeon D22]